MKIFNLLLAVLFCNLVISCGESLEDGFEDANKGVEEKLLYQVKANSPGSGDKDVTITVIYDGDNHVNSFTDGDDAVFFNLDANDKLSSVSSGDNSFLISELYQAPYDLFDYGNVISYDDSKNPDRVEVFTDEDGEMIRLICEIDYDPNPNPFYYTLKAAGIIDVLDQVDLNFGTSSPTLVKANKLLPFNNLKSIICKTDEGTTELSVQFVSQYDEDGYPTQTTVTALSKEGSETANVYYVYK